MACSGELNPDYRHCRLTNTRRALEGIFLPVANIVSKCITEQINAVKVKKVSIKSSDMTSVDVGIRFPLFTFFDQEIDFYVRLLS
jgi:hypothetical protein